MARMRVHELAKELETTNKELIDKILKLGIQVKNHMSTLNESAVQKIRDQYAESRTEKVEEKRIGRAVIRRRKKLAVEEETAAPLAEEELPLPSAEIQPQPEEVPEEEIAPIAPEVPPEKEPEEALPEIAPIQEVPEQVPPMIEEPPPVAEEIVEPSMRDEAEVSEPEQISPEAAQPEPTEEESMEAEMPAEEMYQAAPISESVEPVLEEPIE
ncbi:MAG: translation initiation factor IF-2 N-terminal domain-containing protein, partial [Desulforhabdus sp.]|nr:translation initiation factor IF-2 N-terminal domain-containing protein [Desulforhabdus sp.]